MRLSSAFPRGTFRTIAAVAAAAACLALAACTSSGTPAPASAGGQGPAAQQGTPASGGTITVKQGNKVICVMAVANGRGTCKVPAKNFGVGTSNIYASYSDNGKNGSQSQPISMTVTQAETTTTLAMSPAKVSYANEQADHLSVKVTGAYGGTPTGTVKVTSGGITVCLVKLSAAKGGGAQGSCALAAKKLAVGTRPLRAAYTGDHWYRGSASANQTLTIVK